MIPENANKIPEDYNTNELLNFYTSPDYQFIPAVKSYEVVKSLISAW